MVYLASGADTAAWSCSHMRFPACSMLLFCCSFVALHREKMANIEKTEAAKAKLLAEQATRRDVTMVLPANYNSNFKLHKKGTHTAHRANARSAALSDADLCCPQSWPLCDLFADHQLSPVTVGVNPWLTFFASLCGRPGHLSFCLTVFSLHLRRVGRQASRGISRLSRRAEPRPGHRAGTAAAAAITTVGERRPAGSERPARTARLPGGAG